MKRRVKILVSGRVQGVYFRLFTQKKAKQLSINGHARNLPDGRVEIIAEAGNTAIQELIRWCRKGPITARVDDVEITDLPIDEELTSFEIR
jgi:acylphosphatase